MFSRKLVIVQKPSYFQKSVGWIRKQDLVFKNYFLLYSELAQGLASFFFAISFGYFFKGLCRG